MVENAPMHPSGSLLGHLIPIVASASEPVATQALAYILRTSPDVTEVLVSLAAEAELPRFAVGQVTAEEKHGEQGAKPDLTVRDTEGQVRLLVENKFWAPLTPLQPVAYLDALPADGAGMLLFVVPETRITSVWRELRERCTDKGLTFRDRPSGDNHLVRAEAGDHMLAVTSWRHLLNGLEQAARADGAKQDIAQLRGLTDRMDMDEFLPLAEAEPANASIARRLINYIELWPDVAQRLLDDRIGDKEGLAETNTRDSTGRYLRLHGRFGGWLGVDLKSWRDYEMTPLWWRIYVASDFSGVANRSAEIRNLFPEAFEDQNGSRFWFPIRLTPEVERSRVVDDATAQVRDIADTFRAAFPEGAETDSE